jgi:mono/diheme cytochrome c family protein
MRSFAVKSSGRGIMRSIIVLFIPILLGAATSAPSHTVWDGVYSSAQAARGQKAYDSLCSRCHGEKLMGNDDAPQLVDQKFLDRWEGKSAGALVEYTRKEMPSDGPGKLTRKQCTDMTAYLLSVNGFPAGQSELLPDLDALNGILIQAKK